MCIASQGAIWATKSISTKARRPRRRMRATANAAPSATSGESGTALTVTSRLLRQNCAKPSATAVRTCSSVRATNGFPVNFSVWKLGAVFGVGGRQHLRAWQALTNSAGAAGGGGQRPMSASHWPVVRGVTPSSFWAEVSGVIGRPGMALIA